MRRRLIDVLLLPWVDEVIDPTTGHVGIDGVLLGRGAMLIERGLGVGDGLTAGGEITAELLQLDLGLVVLLVEDAGLGVQRIQLGR